MEVNMDYWRVRAITVPCKLIPNKKLEINLSLLCLSVGLFDQPFFHARTFFMIGRNINHLQPGLFTEMVKLT